MAASNCITQPAVEILDHSTLIDCDACSESADIYDTQLKRGYCLAHYRKLQRLREALDGGEQHEDAVRAVAGSD